jgi:hypothetical protein
MDLSRRVYKTLLLSKFQSVCSGSLYMIFFLDGALKKSYCALKAALNALKPIQTSFFML